jgi:segregation and condensation protein A
VWFERQAVTRMPDVHPEDLKNAWAQLLVRARANRHHLVTREQLSVRAQMSRILRYLRPGAFVEFRELFFEHATPAELVVSLLAILELARESLVQIAQAEPFAPIYVQLVGEGRPALELSGAA